MRFSDLDIMGIGVDEFVKVKSDTKDFIICGSDRVTDELFCHLAGEALEKFRYNYDDIPIDTISRIRDGFIKVFETEMNIEFTNVFDFY